MEPIKPSAAGYWIGGGIILVSAAAAVFILVQSVFGFIGNIDEFDRVSLGESETLELDEGEWVVYWEPDGGTTFAPDVSLYGGRALHQQSHGQSFLALAANRFGGEGLYLLDEPEAALSVTGELALVAVMARAARSGSQLVVATHSPVLLACPGARIYELDANGITETAYDELEAVSLTRAFLEAPERFLRAALAEEG